MRDKDNSTLVRHSPTGHKTVLYTTSLRVHLNAHTIRYHQSYCNACTNSVRIINNASLWLSRCCVFITLRTHREFIYHLSNPSRVYCFPEIRYANDPSTRNCYCHIMPVDFKLEIELAIRPGPCKTDLNNNPNV